MEPTRDARRPAFVAGDIDAVTRWYAAVTRVSVDDLARIPAQRLARLLLERAAEDPTLLGRLYETVDAGPASPAPAARMIVGDGPAMRRIASLLSRFGRPMSRC